MIAAIADTVSAVLATILVAAVAFLGTFFTFGKLAERQGEAGLALLLPALVVSALVGLASGGGYAWVAF